MVRMSARRLTTIGGVLAGVALAGLGAGNAMFGIVLGMLTPTHSDLATEVVRVANDAPSRGCRSFRRPCSRSV